jgi:hypothetical protein
LGVVTAGEGRQHSALPGRSRRRRLLHRTYSLQFSLISGHSAATLRSQQRVQDARHLTRCHEVITAVETAGQRIYLHLRPYAAITAAYGHHAAARSTAQDHQQLFEPQRCRHHSSLAGKDVSSADLLAHHTHSVRLCRRASYSGRARSRTTRRLTIAQTLQLLQH